MSGTTSQPFPDRLKTAGAMVVRAQIFFDCWWYYESIDTRPAIIDTMDDYSEFFRFDSHAHFVSMIMYLGSLYDKTRGTITLPRLAEETAKLLPAKAAAVPMAELKLAEKTAEKLTEIRHKLFAHRSASVSYADAFRNADISANEIETLLAQSLMIVNALLAINNIAEVVHHTPSRNHLIALLRALGANIAKDESWLTD